MGLSYKAPEPTRGQSPEDGCDITWTSACSLRQRQINGQACQCVCVCVSCLWEDYTMFYNKEGTTRGKASFCFWKRASQQHELSQWQWQKTRRNTQDTWSHLIEVMLQLLQHYDVIYTYHHNNHCQTNQSANVNVKWPVMAFQCNVNVQFTLCCVNYQQDINDLKWVSSVLRPHQHSTGYTGDGFYKSNGPTNSIKAMKEMLQKRKKTTKYRYTWTIMHTQNDIHKISTESPLV